MTKRIAKDKCLIRFGSKVKHYRKLAGYSQSELAKVMCLSGSSVISQVENGKCGFELVNIYRLAEVLGVDIERLIDTKEYTEDEKIKHMRYFEIMHNPNHQLRSAFDALLSVRELYSL